jgi:hypothetical protein
MPDGIVSQRDFVQMMGQYETNLSITTGNTVMFDSFTAEPEVRRRNIMNNNVSKLNETGRHFRTEFGIRVQAKSVSAILCASTVSEYRVVDKKTDKTLLASDKRPNYIKEYQKQKETKRPLAAEIVDQPCKKQKTQPFFPQIPLVISESIIDYHPGRPKCDTVAAKQGFGVFQAPIHIPESNIMNFTSSSSPLSPRTVDHSEEEDAGPIPFPFKAKALLIEQQPIFGESSALLSQTAVSDNVRAVESIHDVLESRIQPVSEDLQKDAGILFGLYQRCLRHQNASNT